MKVQIGNATLYLGDCLDILPTLAGVDSWVTPQYHAVVTDPPYGMAFQSNHRKEKHTKIVGDDQTKLLRWVCNLEARHSKYIFMRWDNIGDVTKPKSLITWLKNNHSMGDLEHEHARKTEVCAFYYGAEHYFPNGRPVDVVYGTRTDNEEHPTQKPVGLMQNVVEWTAGVVLDPFMGSGTTGVACANLDRKFIGIEIEEKYFDIACERIQKAYDQPDMFVQPPTKPVQEGMDI